MSFGLANVAIELAGREAVLARWSGAAGPPVWTTRIDGRPYAMEAGRAGDHLMTWGADAHFHLSADLGTLTCSAADPGHAWRRFLLDTAMWSTSLLAGFELLHASAVLGDTGVVAFVAGSGGGKSSIAAELVRRGRPLFCDDILALRQEPGGLTAHPGPPLMNLDASRAPRLVDEVGVPLALIGGETWVKVRRAAGEPAAPAAVCLLHRRAGEPTRLERLAPTVLDLLPYSLGFPHLRGRLRGRFDLFARMATTVPAYRVSADPAVSPGALADLVDPLVRAPTRERAVPA